LGDEKAGAIGRDDRRPVCSCQGFDIEIWMKGCRPWRAGILGRWERSGATCLACGGTRSAWINMQYILVIGCKKGSYLDAKQKFVICGEIGMRARGFAGKVT
jgi:hypothetical protein